MRKLAFLCLALVPASVSAAPADSWTWDDRQGEGIIKPKMSYPAGNFDAIGRMMWSSIRDQARKEEGCREFGCLIVVNDSVSFRLLGFYVRPLAPKTDQDWGANQLDRPLRSKEGIVRFKLADQRFCDWPVRFVLRNPETKEVVPLETTASLCAAKLHNTVLRVRYVKPEVHVLP